MTDDVEGLGVQEDLKLVGSELGGAAIIPFYNHQ